MRTIESYASDSATVVLDGRTHPLPSLIEDDEDGIRWLLAPEPVIHAPLWARATAAGAAGILVPKDGLDFKILAITSERFAEQREEHPPNYAVPAGAWARFDHTPAYTEVYQAAPGALIVATSQILTGFVHGHTHAEYSQLDGLSTVKELVTEAVKDGQHGLALTDHGRCSGHPELQIQCDAAGIKPIFGIEAYFVNDRLIRPDSLALPEGLLDAKGKPLTAAKKLQHDYWHLILWAMDDKGLENLWAMSTESFRDGFYYRPRMDWDTLRRHSEGIMAASGCLRGPLSVPILNDDEEMAKANLGKLLDIYGDRFYLEVQPNALAEQEKVNRALVGMASDFGVPLMATVDSHYPTREDHVAHETWIAIQTNSDVSDEGDLFAVNLDLYMQTEADVRRGLAYLGRDAVDEAVKNTLDLVTRTNARIGGKPTAPVYSKKGGVEQDAERLLDLCIGNWSKVSSRADQDEYIARFEREFALLKSKGFCGYFLMVADYCRHAKSNGILVGPGRGSGAGSLVAYLSDITEVDPIEAKLPFERFMTEGRTSLPDFDVDFPASKKEIMLDYLAEKYGADFIIQIGTHLKLKSKGIVKDLGRALMSVLTAKEQAAVDSEEAMFSREAEEKLIAKKAEIHRDLALVSKIIESAEAGTAGLGMAWDDLWVQFGDELNPYRQKYPQLFDMADKLVGRLKSYGKHAAGVVISTDRPLTGWLPLMGGEDGRMVSQFDMVALELMGLVKFDILTIRTLDTIQRAVDLIRDMRQVDVDVYSWDEEYRDPVVWDEICMGNTLGMFQIETHAGTRLAIRMRPQSMAELADMNTIVRPGPMRSGLTEIYLRRRNGDEIVTYADPRMEAILGESQGCFAAETRVLTREGVREIADLFGSSHLLMTRGGHWVEAEVRSFGVQPLMKVTLRRNKQVKVIHATPEHRWFGRWSDSKSKIKELLTMDLRPKMVLASQMPHRRIGRSTPSPFGIAAGIVFGDGHVTPHQANVQLYGEKAELLKYFSASRVSGWKPPGQNGTVPYVEVYDLPRSWKKLPDLDEGMSFLYGWLAGYFATDGYVGREGSLSITSSKREHLEHFRTIANIVGIGTYSITEKFVENRTLPGGKIAGPATFYTMGLVASTIPEGFFFREEQLSRFAEAQKVREKSDRVQWTVVSVEETDRVEEVYCAVVPDTESFVLEDHLLVGNCPIYQDHVLELLMKLAGYSSDEADEVRKILGKKKVEKIGPAGQEFVQRAREWGGMDREVAQHLWDQLSEFAKYGFNKAHAYSYSMISYWTAWLKIHYPIEFFVAALSTIDKDRIPEFIKEVRRAGYTVLPPDINASGKGFKAEPLAVRYGLDAIKGIGETAVDYLIAGQVYASFEQFDEYVTQKGTKANAGVQMLLAKIGALDSLDPRRAGLVALLEARKTGEDTQCVHKTADFLNDAGLPCTFSWSDEPAPVNPRTLKILPLKPPPKRCTKACRQYTAPAAYQISGEREFSDEDIRAIEHELLGVFLSSTPFDRLNPGDRAGLYGDAERLPAGPPGFYTVAAILMGIRKTKTRASQEEMAFLSLDTEISTVEAVAFPKTWIDISTGMHTGQLCLVVLEKQDGDRGLVIREYLPIRV